LHSFAFKYRYILYIHKSGSTQVLQNRRGQAAGAGGLLLRLAAHCRAAPHSAFFLDFLG
jgi:hypothetical protein